MSGPTDWILRYIKLSFFTDPCESEHSDDEISVLFLLYLSHFDVSVRRRVRVRPVLLTLALSTIPENDDRVTRGDSNTESLNDISNATQGSAGVAIVQPNVSLQI